MIDCPKDNWSYTNKDDPIYLSASIDSQFSPPAWCGLLGYALKKAGAKQVHACWSALIVNISNALPKKISQLKEIIDSEAFPIIFTLLEQGPDTLCLIYRN